MLRTSNRILLGVVLLTVSSVTMAQMVHQGKATSAIQLFLIAIAPAEAPQVVNVNIDEAPTLETSLLGVRLDQARAIVSYRERYGEFQSLLDLLKVEGLSRQLIVRNKRLIEFNRQDRLEGAHIAASALGPIRPEPM
jgi:competence protein ComEA